MSTVTPEQLETVVCRNLKARRLELGLSQVDVAARAEISQPHYSELERGNMAPGLATLAKLADALDTTPSALLSSAGAASEKIGIGA